MLAEPLKPATKRINESVKRFGERAQPTLARL